MWTEQTGWTHLDLVLFHPIRSLPVESVHSDTLSCLVPLTQPFFRYLITFKRIFLPLANLPVSSVWSPVNRTYQTKYLIRTRPAAKDEPLRSIVITDLEDCRGQTSKEDKCDRSALYTFPWPGWIIAKLALLKVFFLKKELKFSGWMQKRWLLTYCWLDNHLFILNDTNYSYTIIKTIIYSFPTILLNPCLQFR